jgi:hypothetical protein
MRRAPLTSLILKRLGRRVGKEASTAMAGINPMTVAVIRKVPPPPHEVVLRSSTPRPAAKAIRMREADPTPVLILVGAARSSTPKLVDKVIRTSNRSEQGKGLLGPFLFIP